MFNSLVMVNGDTITINKNDLIMYAIAGAVVLILVVILIIAFKRRKKNFIKTIPTNLKDE